MAHAIQRRRGTTAEHSTFTGLAGELTVDTDKNVVVVHDGKTPGGHPNAPANHNHDGAYAPVSHLHPELAATPDDVQGGTGDGFVKAKDLKDASVSHAATAGSATSAQEATTAQSAGNADTVDSYHASTTPMAQAIPVAGPSGKLDAGWIPPMADVDAATLKGKIPSVTPQANAIPIAGADGKLASGWFESGGGGGSGGYVEYNTPGTYSFIVPDGVKGVFVDVQGGGGGGACGSVVSGANGGSSSFGTYITATGGTGGPKSSNGNGTAARGTVIGATITFPGPFFPDAPVFELSTNNYAAGGGGGSIFAAGGSAENVSTNGRKNGGRGAGGGGYNGHGGGAGGYGMTFVSGLTSGQSIQIVVGAGGAGGVNSSYIGGNGGPGIVRIWW